MVPNFSPLISSLRLLSLSHAFAPLSFPYLQLPTPFERCSLSNRLPFKYSNILRQIWTDKQTDDLVGAWFGWRCFYSNIRWNALQQTNHQESSERFWQTFLFHFFISSKLCTSQSWKALGTFFKRNDIPQGKQKSHTVSIRSVNRWTITPDTSSNNWTWMNIFRQLLLHINDHNRTISMLAKATNSYMKKMHGKHSTPEAPDAKKQKIIVILGMEENRSFISGKK